MLSLNFLFFFNCISSAKTFYIGDDVVDRFDFNRFIKIDLDSDGWQVVRATQEIGEFFKELLELLELRIMKL